jgi:hypothetical protein
MPASGHGNVSRLLDRARHADGAIPCSPLFRVFRVKKLLTCATGREAGGTAANPQEPPTSLNRVLFTSTELEPTNTVNQPGW